MAAVTRVLLPILALSTSLFTVLVKAGLLGRQDLQLGTQPWVTVDAKGASQTVTPTVRGGSTVSAFPGSVTLPTADADGGSFLLCNEASGSQGQYRPFCAPKAGSELDAAKTYFITWDAAFFEDSNQEVQMTGVATTSDGHGGNHGFISTIFPGSKGYYRWNPGTAELPQARFVDVQLYLAYPMENGTKFLDQDPGPKVRVLRSDIPASEAGVRGGGKNALAIALPTVCGLVALVAIGFFVRWYGRRKGYFGGRRQGYGVRKSRIQRAGVGTNIKLSEGTFSSSPRNEEPNRGNDGTNVFRQELRRQERER